MSVKKTKPIPKLSESRRKAFWKFIDGYDEDGCWWWKGATNNRGYGQFYITGHRVNFMAHRVSYAMFIGPIPENHVIMHRCDNRLCVNPRHLTTGEQKENLHDMINKGRSGLKQHNNGDDCPF